MDESYKPSDALEGFWIIIWSGLAGFEFNMVLKWFLQP